MLQKEDLKAWISIVTFSFRLIKLVNSFSYLESSNSFCFQHKPNKEQQMSDKSKDNFKLILGNSSNRTIKGQTVHSKNEIFAAVAPRDFKLKFPKTLELDETSFKTARDIPVIVDAVKNLDYPITRCVYFTIEAILPEVVGYLSNGDLNIPFLMLGLSGVICQPDVSNTLFEDPNQIDTLFDQIENIEGLIVAVSDIFFPTSLLRIDGKEPLRGDVYRVGLELMNMSYLFRSERIEYEEFSSECEKYKEKVKPSTIETKVFRKWSQLQIELSQKNYGSLSKDGRTLKWRDKNE